MKKKKEKVVKPVIKRKKWFILELENPQFCKEVRGNYNYLEISRIKKMLKNQKKFMVWTAGDKELSLIHI